MKVLPASMEGSMKRLQMIVGFGLVVLVGCEDGATMTGNSNGTGGTGAMSGGGENGGTGGIGTGGDGGSGGASAGAFSSQGKGTLREAQASVAGDEDGMLLAAWTGSFADTSAIGYNVSRDGGLTW